ncbi:MAG: pentapeptide repeat-containing protein [Deltaproteobacteria bacterium]|nr:MAG: pentapeptide repeat-containing protein [Deltaproteobacteria bacterium]
MSLIKNYIEDENIVVSDFETLEGVEFVECHFKGQDFLGESLANTKFIECTFEKCNLSNCSTTGASFRDAKFNESKLLGLNFTTCNNLSDLSFDHCLMDLCIFQALKLKATRFHECSLKGADFSDADLGKTDFTRCNLENTLFNGADLREADLREAANYFIEPAWTKIKGARFSMPEAMTLFKGLGIIVD